MHKNVVAQTRKATRKKYSEEEKIWFGASGKMKEEKLARRRAENAIMQGPERKTVP
jgi:hypothetical protein